MVGLGDDGVGAAVRKAGRQHERIRDQAADRVAGGRELRRLRDGVAKHELRPDGVPQTAFPQHGFRRLAIGRDLGIGDRKAASRRQPSASRASPSSRSSTVSGDPFGAKIASRPTA